MKKEQIEKLVFEIRDFLLERGMWEDVTIYWDGKAIGTMDENGRCAYNDATNLYIYEDDPKRYTGYAGDILTMTFEGALCEALNCGDIDGTWKTDDELTNLFEKYGLHYEMGHSWDLTAVEM